MFVFFIILSVFALDQLSKYLVSSNMLPGQSILVVDNIFYITFVQNKGAAFGVLPGKTVIFVIATIIIIFVISLLFYGTRGFKGFLMFHAALALIIGGALGNLFDRIRIGHVVDFFDFRIWPVFNIADIAIVLGVIIVLYYIIKFPKQLN